MTEMTTRNLIPSAQGAVGPQPEETPKLSNIFGPFGTLVFPPGLSCFILLLLLSAIFCSLTHYVFGCTLQNVLAATLSVLCLPNI